VCTDSLSSLQLLTAMQRTDFPQEIRTHANFNTLALIVQTINKRSEEGGRTTLMKVTAHSGNPLNEWADEEALQAFSKAPQLEQGCPSTQFDCLYQLPQGQGPTFHTVWGTRIKRYATQQVAEMQLSKTTKITRNHKRRIVSNAEQFLHREGQNRSFLGRWLSECKDSSVVRSILMGCGDFYPCNAKLFQWKLRDSAECSLCHAPCETSCHIQCVCPSLEHSRIKAHHTIWGLTFSSIQKYLKRECTAVKEERVNSWHLLEAPKRYQTIANHWKSSLMKINDGSSASEPEDQQVAISFLTDLEKIANGAVL